jgi:hypothetical protein
MKEIQLTQWKAALVDDDDFDELSKYKWYAHKKWERFYAGRKMAIEWRNKTILMHNFIMKTPKWMLTDHKDNNWLKNTRENLRICNASQNGMNRGKLKNNTSWFKW